MKAARTRALHRKHAGTGKHHSSAKHTPTAHRRGAAGHAQVSRRVHLTAKAARARALSAGDVSCCVVDALAWSLRLAGGSVSDSDVLALYWHTADSPEEGATIWATLEAAYAHGLAGVRPVSFGPADLGEVMSSDPVQCRCADCLPGRHETRAGLILGLDLPEGPHAVTLGPDGGAWSWGQLWDLGGEAVIEEAWAVTWP